MNKIIKYVLVIVVVLFAAYNMVYFKKLNEVKASANKTFDAEGYAKIFVNKKLPVALAKAVDINTLIALLQTDADKAFDNYGHALAIGSTRYFMVKGIGKITAVDYDVVQVQTGTDSSNVNIATEYVFGNALRDASNLVNINDFSNTLDLSNVSAEINKIIRTRMLPPFKAKAKPGDNVAFTGAVELNMAHLNTNEIEVIPATLKINP
jgi:predicted lipoprotein